MRAGPALSFTEEVEDAIAELRPLVALESTLLSHGLPKQDALRIGPELEDIVRAAGAVPATIAAMDGKLQVGLTEEQLQRFLDEGAKKASLRDLPLALAGKENWATTVASTMFVAHRAGIRFFATGGIGGVHRGAESSFDESADLTALAQIPVVVVSAGAKSVLDLPKTLERLETLGVPVLGYRCDAFPAFYAADSGLSVPVRLDSVAEIAAVAYARFEQLGGGGLLVVQPPPADLAWTREASETLIAEALAEANAQNISGKHVTPFLLKHLAERSDGRLVRTNLALVRANARLAAEIAVADRAADEASAT